jgi:hypothetical protein
LAVGFNKRWSTRQLSKNLGNPTQYACDEHNGRVFGESGDPIPGSSANIWATVPDFGITVSRSRIAVSSDGKVYVVWIRLQDGKSRIMLSTRNTLPTGTPSAVCAP